jgi:hypothetical protein
VSHVPARIRVKWHVIQLDLIPRLARWLIERA